MVAGDLREARPPRHEHRLSAQHRLQNREPEPLGERREEKGLAVFVEPLPVGVAHLAGECHPVAEPSRRHFALEVIPVRRRLLAADHEALPRELLEEIEEDVEVLVGQAVPHRKQERTGGEETGPGRRGGNRQGNPERDDMDGLVMQDQMPGDVLRDKQRIGDDHGSAVDLPLDIGELPRGRGELLVVRGLVEEVQIMDREDHRHARIERPIARHLVRGMPSGEGGASHHRADEGAVEPLHGLLPPRHNSEPPEPAAR